MMARVGARMAECAKVISGRQESIRFSALWVLGIAFVIGTLVIAVFYSVTLRPIKRQARSMLALAITPGDIPPRMREDGPPELADFAESYNALCHALATNAYSKHYVDNILASMGDALAVCTPQGRVEFANAALSSYLQVPVAHLSELQLDDFIAPATATSFLDAARTGESLLRTELDIESTGKRTRILASVSPLHDDTGTHTGSVCLFLDVSERREVETRNRVLASFPTENPGPVMRVDSGGLIIYANDGSEPLLRAWQCEAGEALPRAMIEAVRSSSRDSDVVALRERLGVRV